MIVLGGLKIAEKRREVKDKREKEMKEAKRLSKKALK